ncbi:MAG: twin-arginine translocation signal domain-containing protein [Thermoguttaceae bacterium]|nr:twin-arginine translocation signal domain-containing protein [Thermoguttaceae bacterium]
MTIQLSRRDFLRASALASASLVAPSFLTSRTLAQEPQKRWFKGNLHMHNQWSDGEPLPEWAINWYKTNGYHFVCPSDHNCFQSPEFRIASFKSKQAMAAELDAALQGETSFWKPMRCEELPTTSLTEQVVQQAQELFGKDSVKTRTVGNMTFVRMKTFDELVEQFVEQDKFIMIPGYEQTGNCLNGSAVHMNFIGVREIFPYIKQIEEPTEELRQSFAKGVELYSSAPYLFTVNHPMWRFYDINPSAIIANPQIRLFELNNNGLSAGLERQPGFWNPENFWDVVNAWRATNNQDLLLGMGSDDRHGYGGAPKAWTMVQSASLDQNALFEAIHAGHMYASNGLDFSELSFDGKTLNVKIDVKQEGKYKIDFIGTKKGYDPTCKIVDVAKSEKTLKRRVETYSDEIGVVLETVEGTEGSYTLKADDLYVRAKIYMADNSPALEWRTRPAAWTQPWK